MLLVNMSTKIRVLRTRVLVDDALLPHVEAFAGLIRPPFLQLPVLVVQATRRVEGVLLRNASQHELS